MSSINKPQDSPNIPPSFSVSDPWNMPTDENVNPFLNRPTLDPSHELTGMPARTAMMPEGIPEALRLPRHTGPVRSAVAILLADELKLADQMDEHLRDEVRDAIAVLALES